MGVGLGKRDQRDRVGGLVKNGYVRRDVGLFMQWLLTG